MIAINEAVEKGQVEVTAAALRNPNALISDLQEVLMSFYQEVLHQARARKKEQAVNLVRGPIGALDPVPPTFDLLFMCVCVCFRGYIRSRRRSTRSF